MILVCDPFSPPSSSSSPALPSLPGRLHSLPTPLPSCSCGERRVRNDSEAPTAGLGRDPASSRADPCHRGLLVKAGARASRSPRLSPLLHPRSGSAQHAGARLPCPLPRREPIWGQLPSNWTHLSLAAGTWPPTITPPRSLSSPPQHLSPPPSLCSALRGTIDLVSGEGSLSLS